MNTDRLPQTERPSLDALNTLPRGELSAVETYKQALEKIDDQFEARSTLNICLQSHQDRVQRLKQVVAMMGGTPSDTAGPWGTFARLVEGTAKLLGSKAAIAALEEGEDHGLREYRTQASKLDPVSRQTVIEELLPAQQETHDKLSVLKQALS